MLAPNFKQDFTLYACMHNKAQSRIHMPPESGMTSRPLYDRTCGFHFPNPQQQVPCRDVDPRKNTKSFIHVRKSESSVHIMLLPPCNLDCNNSQIQLNVATTCQSLTWPHRQTTRLQPLIFSTGLLHLGQVLVKACSQLLVSLSPLVLTLHSFHISQVHGV